MNYYIKRLIYHFSKIVPLDRNYIIMKNIGAGIDDNTGSFFRYLISKKYNDKYKIVWLTDEKMTNLPANTYCWSEKHMPLLKYFYIYRAKYHIWDNKYIFAGKEAGFNSKNQLSIYLSHATPLLKDTHDFIKVGDRADMCLCACEEYSDVIAYSYNVDNSQLFFCGHPRNDELYVENDSLEILGIDSKKKVIMWMPTFRIADNGTRIDSQATYYMGLPLIKDRNDLLLLNECLKELDIIVIVKFHAVQDNDGDAFNQLSNIVFLTNEMLNQKKIVLYQLLNRCEALLSDYSSVTFDYMLLNRPIGYILDDFEKYTIGFATDNPLELMPGEKIYNIDQLKAFFKNVSNGIDCYEEERNKLNKILNKYSDNSCKRLLDILVEKGF